jgi:hypothetical protein
MMQKTGRVLLMREKCKGLWNNDEETFNEDQDGTKKLKTILVCCIALVGRWLAVFTTIIKFHVP